MTLARWRMLAVAAGLFLVSGCAPQAAVQPDPTATSAPATATRTPLPSTPTQTPAPESNIAITAPAGGMISNPVRVTGKARVFEAAFELIVYDSQGKELHREPVLASTGAPEWGTFDVSLRYPAPAKSEAGRIEAVSQSPRDGTVLDRAVVNVTLPAQPAAAAGTPPAAPATAQRSPTAAVPIMAPPSATAQRTPAPQR